MGVSCQYHDPATLYPQQSSPGTDWIEGWMGLRAGLVTEARGKILCLCRGLNPGRPVCSQPLYRLRCPSFSFACNTEVNALSCISTFPHAFIAWCLIKARRNSERILKRIWHRHKLINITSEPCRNRQLKKRATKFHVCC
jgi:hypothetical protein